MDFAASSSSRFSKEEDEEEEQEPEEEEDEEASPREIPFMTPAGTAAAAASSSSSPPATAASASGTAALRSSDDAGASGSGGAGGGDEVEVIEKEHMFDKVVTPSDVGKLNRLVIPKQHAEKYFPLDAAAGNEKGLLLSFEDRAGKLWRFRYSYWNSSQSYVMTKGWSRFVKEKRLDAGDTVSFCRGAGEANRDRLFIDWKRRADSRDAHHRMMPRLPLPMPPVLGASSPYGGYGPWGGARAARHTLRAPPVPPGPRLPQHQRCRAGQAATLLRLRRHASPRVDAAAAASDDAQHHDGAATQQPRRGRRGHVGAAHGSRLRAARQQPDGGRQARAPLRSQPRQPAAERRRRRVKLKPGRQRIVAEDAGMAKAGAIIEVPRVASSSARCSWRRRLLRGLVAVVVLLLQERSALVIGSRSVRPGPANSIDRFGAYKRKVEQFFLPSATPSASSSSSSSPFEIPL